MPARPPRLGAIAVATLLAAAVAPAAIAQHAHDAPRAAASDPTRAADPHAGHRASEPADRDPREPKTPIPPVTPADRSAAFPDVAGHAVHDDALHWLARFNRLEWADTDHGTALAWEASAWFGTDLDRLWLRSEGERVDGRTEAGDLEVLYGHAVAPWWDVVAGVREAFGAGPSRTSVALGIQGLAPYKLEFQATAYLGEGGRSAANVEVEYDTLLTNRLVLQWLAEADWYAEDDPRRGIGSGLATVEAGLRLRYEITRRIAPYLGVAHERAFGATADLRRAQSGAARDTRIVAGVRLWF